MKDVSVLPSAVVAGYLGAITNDPRLNILNAPTLAKERKVNLTSSRSPATSGAGIKVIFKLGAKRTVDVIGMFLIAFVGGV